MLGVPDSVTKSTPSSTNSRSLASTVPLRNNISNSSSSSTTAVRLIGSSSVQVWPRDHHYNHYSKRTCLSKGDSPQKEIEGDTSSLITPSDSVLHDQGLLSVIFSYLSFTKQIQISRVNKDWQHASMNHKDFTFVCGHFFFHVITKTLHSIVVIVARICLMLSSSLGTGLIISRR